MKPLDELCRLLTESELKYGRQRVFQVRHCRSNLQRHDPCLDRERRLEGLPTQTTHAAVVPPSSLLLPLIQLYQQLLQPMPVKLQAVSLHQAPPPTPEF